MKILSQSCPSSRSPWRNRYPQLEGSAFHKIQANSQDRDGPKAFTAKDRSICLPFPMPQARQTLEARRTSCHSSSHASSLPPAFGGREGLKAQLLHTVELWRQSSCLDGKPKLRSQIAEQINQLVALDNKPLQGKPLPQLVGLWQMVYQSHGVLDQHQGGPLMDWYPFLKTSCESLQAYTFQVTAQRILFYGRPVTMEHIVEGLSSHPLQMPEQQIRLHLTLSAGLREDRYFPALITAFWQKIIVRYKEKTPAQQRLETMLGQALKQQLKTYPNAHLPAPYLFRCLYVDDSILILGDVRHGVALLTLCSHQPELVSCPL